MAIEIRQKSLLSNREGRPGDIHGVFYRGRYYLAVRYSEGWKYIELKDQKVINEIKILEENDLRVKNKSDIEVFSIDNDGVAKLKSQMYINDGAAVLDENDIVSIKDPFYLGEDRFPTKMLTIRNEEMNNLLSTADGTEIEVASIDTVNNKITLTWLPYIPSIWNPESGKEWALLNLENITPPDPSRSGDYTAILKIMGGDYTTKTLDYQIAQGSITAWSVGDKVMFYNPFQLWEWLDENPLIEASGTGWRSLYVSSGGVFKRSDGNWVMLVTGTDTTGKKQVGAFISSDLVNWTVMNNDNPVLTPSGGGAGDWRADHIGLASSILKLDTEDRYIAYCSGYNATDGKWRIGWAKFDEDFTPDSIEYSDSEIISSAGSSNGLIAASVIRYGSKYRMTYTDRSDNANPNLATGSWRLNEAESTTPEGEFNYFSTIQAGNLTNDGVYYSSHIDASLLFNYKNRLYLLVGGTSWYKYSGTRGNRVFGLMYLDERHGFPNWVHDTRGPILINPFYGNHVWGSKYEWASDHMGGYPGIASNPNDGKIYLYFSANFGSNTYRIGAIRLDVQNL